MRHIAPRAFLCAPALVLAGCTTIHVHSDGGVVTHKGFGITRIEVPAETKMLVTDTSGVGIVMGVNRLTFGWMNEQAVAVRDTSRCQLVFMSATSAEAGAIGKLLAASNRTIDQICITPGGRNP